MGAQILEMARTDAPEAVAAYTAALDKRRAIDKELDQTMEAVAAAEADVAASRSTTAAAHKTFAALQDVHASLLREQQQAVAGAEEIVSVASVEATANDVCRAERRHAEARAAEEEAVRAHGALVEKQLRQQKLYAVAVASAGTPNPLFLEDDTSPLARRVNEVLHVADRARKLMARLEVYAAFIRVVDPTMNMSRVSPGEPPKHLVDGLMWAHIWTAASKVQLEPIDMCELLGHACTWFTTGPAGLGTYAAGDILTLVITPCANQTRASLIRRLYMGVHEDRHPKSDFQTALSHAFSEELKYCAKSVTVQALRICDLCRKSKHIDAFRRD